MDGMLPTTRTTLDYTDIPCDGYDVSMTRHLFHVHRKQQRGDVHFYDWDIYNVIVRRSFMFARSMCKSINDTYTVNTYVSICNHTHRFTPDGPYAGVTVGFNGIGCSSHVKLSPYVGETGEVEFNVGIKNINHFYEVFPLRLMLQSIRDMFRDVVSCINLSPSTLFILKLGSHVSDLGIRFDREREGYNEDMIALTQYLEEVNHKYGSDFTITDDGLKSTPRKCRSVPYSIIEKQHKLPYTSSCIMKL